MPIRSYQTGDEHAQARIYNTAAGSLPGFKPSTAEEIARRYQAATGSGIEILRRRERRSRGLRRLRLQWPDQLPMVSARSGDFAPTVLETMLLEMRKRGIPEAWTAYRGDWSSVHEFLHQQDFTEKRTMINYVAESSRLPPRIGFPPTGSSSVWRRRICLG